MMKSKKILALALTMAMMFCCLPVSGLVAQATEAEDVYNAAAYFAENTGNSNTGVWQYESRSIVNGDYAYEDMTYSTTWNSSNDMASIQLVTGDLVVSSSNGTTKVMQLLTNDQTTEAVLKFVAPKSGLISVKMANGGVFAPGSASGSDLVRFFMLHNDECIVSEEGLDASNGANNRFFADKSTFYVTAGDTVRFIVGRNKQQGMTYGTRFNPEITYVQEYSSDYSYNACTDFSTEDNPNGVWAYQTLSGGSYRNETWQQFWQSIYSWGNPSYGCMYAAASDQVTGRPAIRARAETRDPVLTFTAPYSGKINVSMANGGVFAPVSQSGKGQIKFTFKQNDTIVKSVDDLDHSRSNSNRFFSDTVELTVKAGDTLRFISHKNNANGTADIYFNPQIDYTEVYPTSFNAHTDFSSTDNPNGTWIYQTLAGGTYRTEAWEQFWGSIYSWGGINTGAIYAVASDTVTARPALRARPNTTSRDVVLTFSAPYSGKINVSMANGGVFAPTSTAGGGQIKFTFKHNDTVVKSIDDLDNSRSNSNRFFADTVQLDVTAGDILRFIVHENNTSGNMDTYFNPQISYTSLESKSGGITYYVSSSSGSDSNAGTVSTAPYSTLAKVSNLKLGENDRILLKAGDTFAEQWILNNVAGTKDAPVVIGSYGDVATDGKPCIDPAVTEDNETANLEIATPCVKLNNASGLEIQGLQITGSGVGIHLNYTNSFNNEYIKISDCDFEDLTGFTIQDYRGNSVRSNGVNITGPYQMATAVCTSVDNYNIGVDDPALIGLYIDGCTTDNCGTLYSTAASIPTTNEGGSKTVNGLYITNSTMSGNDYYGIYVDSAVEGGYISDCTIDGCGDAASFPPGTAGILLSVKDFAVVNNEIKNQQRGGVNYDGVGIDMEHLCDNVIVRNNYIHNNTGSGMLIYNRDGGSKYANVNSQIINNLFVNNASSAQGLLYGHDDPLADIRLTSGASYAANNCTISGNSYYNNIVSSLTYTFVNNHQAVTGTNTIENNTELNAASSDYLETKATVLTAVKGLFGDYNESDYKFGNIVGNATPDYAVVDSHSFTHSTDFGTALDGTVWQYKYCTSSAGFENMTYSGANSRWQYSDTTALVTSTVMHPYSVGQTVLAFVAPQSGRIRISMEEAITVSPSSSDGVYITVLNKNLETLAEPLLVTAGTSKTFDTTYTSVQEGDTIYFCLSRCKSAYSDATTIKPVVEYIYNDLNSDGSIDIRDLIRLKKAIASTDYVGSYDWNCDAQLNSGDLINLTKYLLGALWN